MFFGRVGRFSATAANPSRIAASCPSSSRYHRTRARNLTRLPAPLAVALHRTVGGLVCSIAASPSLRRLGLHRPGGDGTRPWRGSDDTLSARTACRPAVCTAARQPAPRTSRLRLRAPDFEPGRCRGAYGRVELHGSANNERREETVCCTYVASQSPRTRPSEATNATGTITRVRDVRNLRDSDITASGTAGGVQGDSVVDGEELASVRGLGVFRYLSPCSRRGATVRPWVRRG